METETEKLVKKFIIGLIVVIIFAIPTVIFLINKFIYNDSSIIKKIDNKETFMILVKDYSCNNCIEIKNIIEDNNYDCVELNSYEENKYKNVLNKIDLSLSDIKTPSVIYVDKGKVYSFLVDVKIGELKTYLKNINNLGSE